MKLNSVNVNFTWVQTAKTVYGKISIGSIKIIKKIWESVCYEKYNKQ